MATLYVASTETFVGKSAVCISLLSRMRSDGFCIGYMKPISVSVTHTSDSVIDEDATFIRQSLALDTPIEQIAPILITSSAVEAILRGQVLGYTRKLKEAYLHASRDKDVMVLEGTNTWAEGAIVDLTPDQVTDLLDAPCLLISHYRTTLAVDTILTIQRYIGDRLLGVVLNQVEERQLDFVRHRITPFLESHAIPVLGILPHDRLLSGVTVAEYLEHLGGQLIGKHEWCEKLIDNLMVGAMGVEAGLSYFRRRANKAVITGGDRTDLQLVALETSTNLLILTGNIRPTLQVIDRAEEREVAIILVPDDTLSTIERVESLFGKVRFHQQAKLQRFIELMDQHFDYPRLYDALGLGVNYKNCSEQG